MAQHLAAENTEPETQLPSNRSTTIVNVIKRLAVLDDERRALTAEINDIKQREIKGELGMLITDFNIARRMYLLEGDDRRQMLATLRETFDALGVGEQLDFLSAVAAAE